MDIGRIQKFADALFRLRIRRSLPDDDQRFPGLAQQIKRTVDGLPVRYHFRSRVEYGKEGLFHFRLVDDASQQGRRQIQVDPSGAPRYRGTDGTRQSDADVLRTVDTVGSLGKSLRHIHLVQPFVIALLQVDDGTVAGTADLNHRKAVDGGRSQGGKSVQETGGRHGEANTGLSSQETGNGSRVSRRLLVTETDVTDAPFLCVAGQVRHRNPYHSVDGIESVAEQSLHHNVHPIGQIRWLVLNI